MTRVVTLWATLLLASPVSAQTPTDELEARALFEAGQQAVERAQFDDAQRLFERSLELHPTPAAAFNAAVAAEEAGALPTAIGHLDRLLAGDYGALPPARRDAVGALRDSMVERVGTLVVRADAPEVQVRIGEETLDVHGEATVHLAAGTHRFVVEVPGRAPRPRQITLSAGERRTVDLMLEARVDTEIAAGPSDVLSPDTSRGPDLGLILGVAVGAALAIGAGIAIGIAVDQSQSLPDGFVGRAETLR